MTVTLHRSPRPPGGLLAATFVLGLVLANCSSAGTAATAGATTMPPAVSPPASAGAGGPSASPAGGIVPGGGEEFVIPKPGQLDVHPIAADSLAARVDGHHVIVTITYTSGVEPCSVLDTIVVERGDHAFAITLRQGHGPGNEVCIMIAKVMQTQVDLGELDPGTYTITDTTRGADPIQVIVG